MYFELHFLAVAAFLLCVFLPHVRTNHQPRYADRFKRGRHLFGTPFLVPSHAEMSKQCSPKQDCLVTKCAAGLQYLPLLYFKTTLRYTQGRHCAGLWLHTPSHVEPVCIATLPSPVDFYKNTNHPLLCSFQDDLCVKIFRVVKACTAP